MTFCSETICIILKLLFWYFPRSQKSPKSKFLFYDSDIYTELEPVTLFFLYFYFSAMRTNYFIGISLYVSLNLRQYIKKILWNWIILSKYRHALHTSLPELLTSLIEMLNDTRSSAHLYGTHDILCIAFDNVNYSVTILMETLKENQNFDN